MNRLYLFLANAIMTVFFVSCGGGYFVVDVVLLHDKIYDPTAVKYEGLQSSTVLYLDHSTCVIDAVKNSKVFEKLRPNLGQYCDTLQLIKGSNFESIPLDRQDNKVSEVLETINNDIPFADIRKAVFQICNSNQQAILITDCESYANGRFLDLEPYMSEPFKVWLEKGHTINIITEPYQEKYRGKIYDKKRFYFIFSDDRMPASISNNFLAEVRPLSQDSIYSVFKMTNTDIFVQSPKNNMVAEDLTFTVEYGSGYEFIEISDDWNAIREYVMKLDKYGEPIPGGEPMPLIENLVFANGVNYTIEDIQIVATNITSQYLALGDTSIVVKKVDISNGFKLDKNAMQNNKLNVMLTDKIFTDGYLSDEFGGNLIRLDFVITYAGLISRNNAIFEWESVWSPNVAICVSKSIDNALRDVAVVPTCPDRRVVHTTFIKAESYK